MEFSPCFAATAMQVRNFVIARCSMASASTRASERSSETIANSSCPPKLEITTVLAGVGDTMTNGL